MTKTNLTIEQKKADVDLNIIINTTLLVLGIFMIFQSQFKSFSNNKNIHILIRTTIMALMQFGVAGLGVTVMSIFRKEKFLKYGLKQKGTITSIVLSSLMFVPNVMFNLATGAVTKYMPFQSVWITNDVISSRFPINIIGIALIVIAWGFFEGFNYVVIYEKINMRFPTTNKWLNRSAILCAIMCISIHGIIGISPENIIEAITVFIIIYGMLMVKEFTGNAWGCVFIFIFLWNAF